jgi:hypothetical protein
MTTDLPGAEFDLHANQFDNDAAAAQSQGMQQPLMSFDVMS